MRASTQAIVNGQLAYNLSCFPFHISLLSLKINFLCHENTIRVVSGFLDTVGINRFLVALIVDDVLSCRWDLRL